MDPNVGANQRPGSWWCERELLWLVLIVLIAHFVQIEVLPLRGEESRRAHVAGEMLRTGDWIVPHQQGEPYFGKPPLQNWLIAGATLIRGECDTWAVRLPSAFATLLTTLLIYGYSRTFLSRLGALSAGAAYATMIQVLQMGGQGETDALLTLFIASSLLVWHWGMVQGWPAWQTWMLAYGLAALGALAKGPQAPIYLVAVVSVHSLVCGQWRRLFSGAHVLGVATFAVLFGAWAVPYYLRMDADGLRRILGDQSTTRFLSQDFRALLLHMAAFPLEVVGCLLPWSALLLAYLHRPFRERLGDARPAVFFLWLCIVVTFPSCWITPAARSRYYMPMYPCFAPLVGLVVQRYLDLPEGSVLRRGWSGYVSMCALIFVGVAALALGGGVAERLTGWQLAQPPAMAVGVAAALLAAAVLLFRLRQSFAPAQIKLTVVCLASAFALSYSLWFMNILINRKVDAPAEMARLNEQLAGQRLVSLEPIHHLFAYYYQDPIPVLRFPQKEADLPPDVTYFCLNVAGTEPQLPFAWERVAVINCDRNVRPVPLVTVVVGRRITASPPNGR